MSVYYLNRMSASSVCPRRLFRLYVHEHIKEPHTLYIFIVSDSGLMRKYQAKNFVDSRSRFVFVETAELAQA